MHHTQQLAYTQRQSIGVEPSLHCFSLPCLHRSPRLGQLGPARAPSVRGPAPCAAAAPDSRFKHLPRTFTSEAGEKFLFQFGEGLNIYELPEKTRVIYPGVRKNAPNDPETMEAMIR